MLTSKIVLICLRYIYLYIDHFYILFKKNILWYYSCTWLWSGLMSSVDAHRLSNSASVLKFLTIDKITFVLLMAWCQSGYKPQLTLKTKNYNTNDIILKELECSRYVQYTNTSYIYMDMAIENWSLISWTNSSHIYYLIIFSYFFFSFNLKVIAV